jgi:hypothetical protein
MKTEATLLVGGSGSFPAPAFRAVFFSRVPPFLAVLPIVLLLAAGCARSQMERIMPNMDNMQLMHAYFGDPTASVELPDGTVRHEWVLDRLFTHPGGTRTVLVYVGHDRDGFREYVEREVEVRQRTEYQHCTMTAIVDRSGMVLRTAWEGRNCDELPRMRMAD